MLLQVRHVDIFPLAATACVDAHWILPVCYGAYTCSPGFQVFDCIILGWQPACEDVQRFENMFALLFGLITSPRDF